MKIVRERNNNTIRARINGQERRSVIAMPVSKSALRVHFFDDDDADDFVDLKIGQANGSRRKPLAAGSEDTGSLHEDDDDDRDEAIAEFHGKYDKAVKRVIKRGHVTGKEVYGFKTPKRAATKSSATAAVVNPQAGANAFFVAHDTGVHTSDKTLHDLRTPRLSEEALTSILAKQPLRHKKQIERLLGEYRAKFDKWMLLLHEEFNIVTFGLGSKKRVLQDFHRQMLAEKDVIVVNGFFPSLTIKSVLDAITQGLLDRDAGFVAVQEQVAFILSAMSQAQRSEHIYLIVHNIDGPMLRSSMAQSVFSQLAAHPKIHLICSIDHINAPLIWDQRKMAKFSFVWFDTTTFLPYSEETVNASSFMVEQSGAPTLSSLNRVFESLNSNARDIYLLVARFQVEALEDAEEASHYAGLMLSELYQKCREAFLVTSKMALRAQLTEFTDHKVISLKSTDGTEYVTIPLELTALAHF